MSQRNLLLTLVVHKNTEAQYYHKHDLFAARQKKQLEEIRKEPFESLLKDRQSFYLDTWFWPPWRFNDIAGFAEIELETAWTVSGHLYLPKGWASVKKPLYLNFACASASFEKDSLAGLRAGVCHGPNLRKGQGYEDQRLLHRQQPQPYRIHSRASQDNRIRWLRTTPKLDDFTAAWKVCRDGTRKSLDNPKPENFACELQARPRLTALPIDQCC